jgi:hypothetical protein
MLDRIEHKLRDEKAQGDALARRQDEPFLSLQLDANRVALGESRGQIAAQAWR